MKVLIIPEYDRFGGTFTFFKRLLDLHRTNHIDTAVLIPQDRMFPEVAALLDESQFKTFFRTLPAVPLVLRLLAVIEEALQCIIVVKRYSPDIIVVSVGTTGKMLGALLGPVPVLFVMHGYPQQRQRWFTRWLVRRAASRTNAFVSVSRFAAEENSRKLGLPREQISVVYNCFTPPRQQTCFDNGNLVLTIGHVTWHKNPQVWLTVAKKVLMERPDVCFTWVGDGDKLEKMRKKVDEEGLAGSVSFHGYDADVEKFYQQALVYFQPSILESQGISLVDAMARGIPCVASNAGGLSEMVIDGETGYTSPWDDVGAFAENILRLLHNNKLRDEMGKAGRNRAQVICSPVGQERKYLELYRTLVRKHG